MPSLHEDLQRISDDRRPDVTVEQLLRNFADYNKARFEAACNGIPVHDGFDEWREQL